MPKEQKKEWTDVPYGNYTAEIQGSVTVNQFTGEPQYQIKYKVLDEGEQKDQLAMQWFQTSGRPAVATDKFFESLEIESPGPKDRATVINNQVNGIVAEITVAPAKAIRKKTGKPYLQVYVNKVVSRPEGAVEEKPKAKEEELPF